MRTPAFASVALFTPIAPATMEYERQGSAGMRRFDEQPEAAASAIAAAQKQVRRVIFIISKKKRF